MNNFAKNLRFLRKKKNLSQDAFGDLVFCSATKISFLENGVYAPSLDLLIALAKFFEVSLDELVLGDLQ